MFVNLENFAWSLNFSSFFYLFFNFLLSSFFRSLFSPSQSRVLFRTATISSFNNKPAEKTAGISILSQSRFRKNIFFTFFFRRSISRVYLSSGEEPPLVGGRWRGGKEGEEPPLVVGGGGRWRGGKEGEEPRLTAWRRTGDQDASLPPLPARRAPTPPPNRPPKPRGGSGTPTEEGEGSSSKGGSGEPDSNSESSVWYEYGCV